MPTIVTYNNIEIHNVLVKRFEQRMQYDPTNTDVLFSRFTITCEGLIHSQGFANHNDGQGAAPMWTAAQGTSGKLPSVGTLYPQIARALWQPRCTFNISMGGIPIFICNPPSSSDPYGDLDNGPKPKIVELTHITSNNAIGPTFHVTFEIECAQSTCPGLSGGNIPPVTDNRWSVGESLDDEYFTSRTIHGQVRFSSNDIPKDAFRVLCLPTLERGFKRERIDYNIQADGLTVDYVVSDKQIHTSAPWPAVKLNVRHSEGTADGGKFESECHVSLHGHPGADKLALISLAVRIIEDRLGKFKTMVNDFQGVPIAFMVVDTIGERNQIEMYLKLQHSLGYLKDIIQPDNFLACPIGKIGRPLNLDPSSGPSIWGTLGYPRDYDPDVTDERSLAPWGYNVTHAEGTKDGEAWRKSGITRYLMECFLQYPCNFNHWLSRVLIGPNQQPDPRIVPPPGTTDKSQTGFNPPIGGSGGTAVQQNSDVPSWSQPQSASSLADPKKQLFTFAAAETKLDINPMRVQLPIGVNPKPGGGYKPGDDTCVIGTLGLPMAQLTFYIKNECPGQWPSIPEPVPFWQDTKTGIKGSLLSCRIEPMPPTVDPMTSKAIYHVSCKYVYALNRPPTRNERIPIGILPFTPFTSDQTALTLSDLYKDPKQQIFTPLSGLPLTLAPY